MAGELANYQTSSQVSAAISSALSSYDDSSQVDYSKIITALLDFYTRAETDQAIADAVTGGVDLSNYYTISETQSYVANELLSYYPRTELDSLLTATLTQYWTSFLDPDGDRGRRRYLVRASRTRTSGQIFNLVQEQFTPRSRAQFAFGGAAGRRRDSGQPVHPAHPKRLLVQGRGGQPLPEDQRPRAPRRPLLRRGPRRRGRRDVPKEASRAPSSLRTVTRAFWICRSPAALCSWGVATKLVAVRLLTVRSAAGSTPGAFSRSVTRWPRELKLAMRG